MVMDAAIRHLEWPAYSQVCTCTIQLHSLASMSKSSVSSNEFNCCRSAIVQDLCIVKRRYVSLGMNHFSLVR